MSVISKTKIFEVETEFLVRFSEVDSMRVVWHGNYLKYLEDGREAFGRKYGLGYMDFFDNGMVTPLVSVECKFKRPLFYGDTGIISTRYIDTDASKLVFEYTIYNKDTREVLSTARTVQVFLNTDRELLLTFPEFFINWKKKVGLISNNV